MNSLSYYDKHHYLLFKSIYDTLDPNLRRAFDYVLSEFRIELIDLMCGRKAKTTNDNFLLNPNSECIIRYMKYTSSGFEYYVQIKGSGYQQRINGRYLNLL